RKTCRRVAASTSALLGVRARVAFLFADAGAILPEINRATSARRKTAFTQNGSQHLAATAVSGHPRPGVQAGVRIHSRCDCSTSNAPSVRPEAEQEGASETNKTKF